MIRRATLDDLGTLLELEKVASSTALSHVFPPELPFPADDVLARWRIVLEDPGVTVLLDLDDDMPIGYAAIADGWLRHFGLLPDWWGTGRAQSLHTAAIETMRAEGADQTYLWVLVDNHRARAFYERLGWQDTGIRESEVFEPFPVKMQMVRLVSTGHV